jgi:hypothetical protein
VLNNSGRSGIFELVERDAWLDFFAAAPDHCTQALEISSEGLGDMGLLASREVVMCARTTRSHRPSPARAVTSTFGAVPNGSFFARSFFGGIHYSQSAARKEQHS